MLKIKYKIRPVRNDSTRKVVFRVTQKRQKKKKIGTLSTNLLVKRYQTLGN